MQKMKTLKVKTYTAGKKTLLQKRRALIKNLKFRKVIIFRYNNLKNYLQAWYRKNKKAHGNLFGYELITRRLGNKSRSATHRVFQGKKLPSNQTVSKFITLLELSSEEANYLILLSHFSKVKRKGLQKKQLLTDYKKLLKKKK